MPIYLGSTKIKDIYLGSTRIKSIFLGSTQVYSEGINILVRKLLDLPIIANAFTVDDNYIYVASSSTSTVAPTIYRIDKNTHEAIELTSPFPANYQITHICSNNSVVLFVNAYGKYAWYDIATNKFSTLYDRVSSVAIISCGIDKTYSYFGVSNGLVRINNSTKTSETFSYNGMTPNTMIVDANYVYMYSIYGECYIFNKSNSSISLLTNKPSGVETIMHNIYSQPLICQNNNYVFHGCKSTNGEYNQIMVTDKKNKTTILTPAISEMSGMIDKVACIENYLFVIQDDIMVVYDLSVGFNDYTVINLNGKNVRGTDTNNGLLYLATRDPIAVFTYEP